MKTNANQEKAALEIEHVLSVMAVVQTQATMRSLPPRAVCCYGSARGGMLATGVRRKTLAREVLPKYRMYRSHLRTLLLRTDCKGI